MRNIVRVSVLVDWHNTEAAMRSDISDRRPRRIQDIISRIQGNVADALKRRDSTVRYRASMRFYHGWHVDNHPTQIRLEFDRLSESESFARTIGIVSFTPEIRFGNELACDTSRNPLFSTSRSQGQKMVDTALSCDLLFLLRSGLAELAVIVSDDDDFIPAVFTAEAWGLSSILLRSAGRTIDHISEVPAGNLVHYWS